MSCNMVLEVDKTIKNVNRMKNKRIFDGKNVVHFATCQRESNLSEIDNCIRTHK